MTEDIEYLADAIVFGAPTFLAHYIIEGAPPATGFQYSPWLTANLTLDRMPRERDAEVAWDNVIYDSPALGYVDATHMSVASRQDRAVWTYYWSLAEHSPEQARALLLKNDWSYWKEAILNDLIAGASGYPQAAFRASTSCEWDMRWFARPRVSSSRKTESSGYGRQGKSISRTPT